MEIQESVKSSIALDAAVCSHTKRRQHVSLDKTAPMRTENLLTSAVGAGTFEGTVHFRFLGALSNGRRHLINGEPIGDVHSVEYPVLRRIDGERTGAPFVVERDAKGSPLDILRNSDLRAPLVCLQVSSDKTGLLLFPGRGA